MICTIYLKYHSVSALKNQFLRIRSCLPHVSLLLFFIVASLAAHAQRLIESNGKSLIRIEKNMTESEAIELAKTRAIIQAIENEFGTVVIHENALYIKNEEKGGLEAESSNIFNSISNTLVNGEWVKTIKEKHDLISDSEGYRYISFEITGMVRELKKIPFTPVTLPLTCKEVTCKSTLFNSGQLFYLYFKAPKNGFVTVFLEDGTNAFRILPYQKQDGLATYPVTADMPYVFFSRNKNQQDADAIELYSEKSMEINRLYVLFSEKDFNKPLLNKGELTSNGYIIPKSLTSNEFIKWIHQLRSFNKNIEMEVINLTIKK